MLLLPPAGPEWLAFVLCKALWQRGVHAPVSQMAAREVLVPPPPTASGSLRGLRGPWASWASSSTPHSCSGSSWGTWLQQWGGWAHL